jgi:hypothetical protein
MSDVDFAVLLWSVLSVNGYELGRFGESIQDDLNQIKLVGK